MNKVIPLLIATFASAQALAHDGHGLSGSHWHSTDVWGFGVVVAIAIAAWLTTRGT